MTTFNLEKKNEATATTPYISTTSENIPDFPHFHQEVEVIRCECGQIKVTQDNETFWLNAGEILFFMPYEIHNIVSEQGSLAMVMKIYQERNKNLSFENLQFETCVITPAHAIYSEINPIIDRIKTENTKKAIGFEIATTAAVNELLLMLIRGVKYRAISKAASDIKLKNIAILSQVNGYLQENYTARINLEQMARHCNMSKFYFSRIFKDITGMGFCDYLNAFRVRKAAELMQKKDCSQLEIALDVGFNNYQSFLRVFKKMYGTSPRQFRN